MQGNLHARFLEERIAAIQFAYSATGNALAYSKYDLYFMKEELQARWKKVGLWASEFRKPEVFRKNQRNSIK